MLDSLIINPFGVNSVFSKLFSVLSKAESILHGTSWRKRGLLAFTHQLAPPSTNFLLFFFFFFLKKWTLQWLESFHWWFVILIFTYQWYYASRSTFKMLPMTMYWMKDFLLCSRFRSLWHPFSFLYFAVTFFFFLQVLNSNWKKYLGRALQLNVSRFMLSPSPVSFISNNTQLGPPVV